MSAAYVECTEAPSSSLSCYSRTCRNWTYSAHHTSHACNKSVVKSNREKTINCRGSICIKASMLAFTQVTWTQHLSLGFLNSDFWVALETIHGPFIYQFPFIHKRLALQCLCSTSLGYCLKVLRFLIFLKKLLTATREIAKHVVNCWFSLE